MILKVNYEVDGINGIAYLKNRRIITKDDVKKVERLIGLKIKKKGVIVTNWKIVGSIEEKMNGGINR